MIDCSAFRLTLLSLLALLPAGASSAEPQPSTTAPEALADPFQDGANCLFIGHSFFIPVAVHFDRIARQNEFSAHAAAMVFAPGMAGSPGALWESERHRERIESHLATGRIELLGMTVAGPRGGALEDYQRWINLALKHNPKTRIFIGHCWIPGGPQMESARYRATVETSGLRTLEIVQQLREAYPATPIYFINYGLIAADLKERFEAGELPEITQIAGRDPSALFRDPLGHAGPFLLEQCANAWLALLYHPAPGQR